LTERAQESPIGSDTPQQRQKQQSRARKSRARRPLEADAAVDVAVWLGSVAKCAGWRPRYHWPRARAGGEDASERPYRANVPATAGNHTTPT
jgi:hypothetical protein